MFRTFWNQLPMDRRYEGCRGWLFDAPYDTETRRRICKRINGVQTFRLLTHPPHKGQAAEKSMPALLSPCKIEHITVKCAEYSRQ